MSVLLNGSSGRVFEFLPYDRWIEWYDVPGIYAFAAPALLGWRLFYIGIAESFKSRMSGHEQWAPAVGLGATHVLARVNANYLARAEEERDLIGFYNPPLNVQHRTDASLHQLEQLGWLDGSGINALAAVLGRSRR